MDTKVILKNVRFAYVHVFEKDAMCDKYTARIIIKKNDPQVADLKAAIRAAVEASKAKLGNYQVKLSDIIHDGDADDKGEEYQGCWYLNAKAKTKPGVVKVNNTGMGGKTTEITDESEFFSGCYGMVSLAFFAYNQGVNRGVGVGLNNICKTKGDSSDYLGGRSSAESDFGGALDDAGFASDDDDIM